MFDLAIDTSAIMATLLDESTADEIASRLRSAKAPVISAATLLELSIVAAARVEGDGAAAVRSILDAADVVTIPVDEATVEAAFDGWGRFGKGNHPASLSFGDCFSRGLAKQYGIPLLFVGADFIQTDLTRSPT